MMRSAKAAALAATLFLPTFLPTAITQPAEASACTPTWKLVDTSAVYPAAQGIQSVSALSARDVRFHGLGPDMARPVSLKLRNGTVAEDPVQIPVGPSTAVLPGSVSFDSAGSGLAHVISTQNASGMSLTSHWQRGRWTLTPMAHAPDPAKTGVVVNTVASLSLRAAWAVGLFYRASPDVPAGLESTGTMIQRWDGTQWTLKDNPTAAQPGAFLSALTAVSGTDIWAVGRQPAANGTPAPMIQHYDGKQWSVVPAPPSSTAPAVLNGVVASGSSDVWAVGAQLRPGTQNEATGLVMHWDGTAWTTVTGLPDLGNSSLTNVFASGPDDVWAVGEYGPNEVETLLHWDGASWQEVPGPGPQQLGLIYNYVDIDGTGSDDVWAVGLTMTKDDATTQRPLVAHLSCGRW